MGGREGSWGRLACLEGIQLFKRGPKAGSDATGRVPGSGMAGAGVGGALGSHSLDAE